MPNYQSQVMDIVARCRRVGWRVEQADGREDWVYRIAPPGHPPVYIHGTPSDANWSRVVWRELHRAGFVEAEEAWIVADQKDRAARLAADKKKAAAKTARLAAQSAAIVTGAGKLAGPQEVDPNWLLVPSEVPETRTVIMTPAVAEKVLAERNTHNRPLSPSRVGYFEALIEAGEFGATHQGGALDVNGTLQDGQSRLAAIASTGKPQTMQWSIGMPVENFKRVDTGTNRSARDTAYIMGETDPGLISSTAKVLLVVEQWGPNAHTRGSKDRISNDRVGTAITHYGEPLRQAVALSKPLKRELRRANPSALAAAVYLIRQRLPESDPRVERFLRDLLYGEGLVRTDPVWLLRRQLLNGPADGRRGGHRQWDTLALIIKTWNRRAQGTVDMRQLSWRSNEAFPSAIFLPPPLEES